jgi:hypothetical protein
MKRIDQVFAWLLLLLGCVHSAGTFLVHKSLTIEAVWFFSGGLVLVFGALLNLLRIARPQDRMTAGVCLLADLLLFAVFVIAVPWTLWHDLKQNPQVFVVGVAVVLELVFAVKCFLSQR